ncbi:zinc finger protein [Holotrichia oblita]|uniref:Zinc finger protein n=1 Tax=Holotrichia oblita TaxID=644536 RepID=A0ACB9T5N6_HOLOL|nr:zinc finger protein [Holotrichia oblita]
MDVQALNKVSCIVPGCPSIDNPQQGLNSLFFFQFPNDANMRKIWKFACTVPDDSTTDAGKICQLHFDPSDYEKVTLWDPKRGMHLFAKLKFYAIPSQNLPRSTGNTNSSSDNKTQVKNLEESANLAKMRTSRKKCAAAFCNSQSETVFDFPHYEHCKMLYSKWLSICADEVKVMTPEILTETYGICDNHFEKETLILPALLPTLQYLDNIKQDASEAIKTCRLCFRTGVVDLFSYKYSDKLLKDIIKIFIPIDIKPNDISKLICEICKSDVIRFYNFLRRSLQVDNYFQMINKTKNAAPVAANKPAAQLPEVIVVKSEDEEEEVTVEDTIVRAESTILEQRLTTNVINMTMVKRIGDALKSSLAAGSVVENEKCDYRVPKYVLEHFHNYGKPTKSIPNSSKAKTATKRVRKSSKKKQELLCIHCNKTIENVDAIGDHWKENDHPPITICRKCNKMFKSQEELDEHSKTHVKYTGCICEKCGKLFKKRENLSIHLSTVHSKWKIRHECKTCSRKFSTGQTLKEHINRIHKNYKPFCCEHCGATFTTMANLRDHQFTHSNYKPHICLICNKVLDLHMSVHTGKKRYECHVCKRRFTQKPHLQSHMLIHTGEKPYGCKHCTKSFAHLSTLIVHERIHTGETPYVCQVCGKGYGHLTNYKKHAFSQHGLTTPKKRDYSGMRIVTEEDNEENDVAKSVESSVFNATEEAEDDMASEDEEEEVTVEDTIVRAESTILEQRLTTNVINMTMVKRIGDALKSSLAAGSVVENEKCDYRVPKYVLEHFHNYGKPTKSIPNSSKAKTATKRTIENVDAIGDHWKENDHPPITICRKCNKMFKSQEELDEHSKTHVKYTGCICEKCGKLFKKRENLSIHLSTVHSKWKIRHECKTCSRKFSTGQTLKEHINRIHKNYKPFCCEHCGATFTTMANLRDHQFTHSNYKPHICLICNKGFHRRNKLKVHLIKHTGERNYSCEKCGIAYKRKLNLRRHNRKYHPAPGDPTAHQLPRKCSHCNTTIDSVELLKAHMRLHRKKIKSKNFDCKYCDKKFVNTTVLDLHMSVHTGKKRYECHVCKRRFTQKPHLQSHMLIHTGEKPYGCKHCTKSFAHLSTLIVHERIHTGKPHTFVKCAHGLTTPKKRDYSGMRIVTEEDNEENDVAKSVESSVFNATEEAEDDMAVMMAEAKATLSTPKKVGVKGKIIHSQGREIIANVLKFMKEEAGNNTPTIELSHYKERLLAATGISDSTYRSIVKEVGDIDAGGVTSFSSPGKKRSRPSPKSTLRTEEKQTIRTIVHNFYIHERRRPTIRGIYDKILENGIPFKVD